MRTLTHGNLHRLRSKENPWEKITLGLDFHRHRLMGRRKGPLERCRRRYHQRAYQFSLNAADAPHQLTLLRLLNERGQRGSYVGKSHPPRDWRVPSLMRVNERRCGLQLTFCVGSGTLRDSHWLRSCLRRKRLGRVLRKPESQDPVTRNSTTVNSRRREFPSLRRSQGHAGKILARSGRIDLGICHRP